MPFCSTCGSATNQGERFCRQCGSAVAEPDLPAPQQGGYPPQQPAAYGQQPYAQPGYGYQQPAYAVQPYGGYAWQQGSPMGDPTLAQYDVQYPPSLSRGLIFIKWLLAIPHFIVLMFYGIGAYVVTLIAWFAILFTGRYPEGMFNFVVRALRYGSNLNAYLMLMRDEYPPFGGAEGAYPSVRLTLGYSEKLSRGLIFIKWLLIIPHFVALYFLGAAAMICTFIAWFAILFSGRYPEGMFRFVVGVHRWQLRASAYLLLLTDRYPPFSMEAMPDTPPAQYAPA